MTEEIEVATAKLSAMPWAFLHGERIRSLNILDSTAEATEEAAVEIEIAGVEGEALGSCFPEVSNA